MILIFQSIWLDYTRRARVAPKRLFAYTILDQKRLIAQESYQAFVSLDCILALSFFFRLWFHHSYPSSDNQRWCISISRYIGYVTDLIKNWQIWSKMIKKRQIWSDEHTSVFGGMSVRIANTKSPFGAIIDFVFAKCRCSFNGLKSWVRICLK